MCIQRMKSSYKFSTSCWKEKVLYLGRWNALAQIHVAWKPISFLLGKQFLIVSATMQMQSTRFRAQSTKARIQAGADRNGAAAWAYS